MCESMPAEMTMRKPAFERSTAMVLPDLITGAVIMSDPVAEEEVISRLLDENRRLSYCQWVESNHYEFVRSLDNE
jgi:hypothetical protein